jgi:hypothetical protein
VGGGPHLTSRLGQAGLGKGFDLQLQCVKLSNGV